MLIEPWHWLILGLVLIILELFLTSFVSLSIGGGDCGGRFVMAITV